MLINFRANLIDLIGIGILGIVILREEILRVGEFNLKGNKIQNFYLIWWESNLMIVKFT